MKANEYFPHGFPQVMPPNEFFIVHERLREPDYRGPWLREAGVTFVRQYAKAQKAHYTKSATDEIYYLWALCLQAEIHDYYGDYDEARGVLNADGERLKKDMEARMLGARHPGEPSRPLRRQQLWALVLYAHCYYRRYRMPDLQKARDMLLDIRKQVDQYFPLNAGTKQDEPSYGLRARIAYSLGQVARQMSDLGARGEFISAIRFTRKRLMAKIEKSAGFQDREQKYANYMIAKAFSFGLAWASYQCGELQRALGAAAAGSALLGTTHDEVHASFAQVMYAEILSATISPIRHGDPVPSGLAEAIETLEPLADKKRSPLNAVPKFLARAQYTLARVYFTAGRYRDAEKLTQEVYATQKPGSRWHLECCGLLVRLLLVQKRVREARNISDVLIELNANGTDSQRIEAFLCRAEMLMQGDSKNFGAIDAALKEAENLAKGNPLSTAICGLQRARYYIVIGNKDLAQEEISKWETRKHTIEHRYVFQLAEDVKRELSAVDHRLIILPEDLTAPFPQGRNEETSGAGASAKGARKRKQKKTGAYLIVNQKAKIWLIGQLYARYGERYLLDENPDQFLGVTKTTVEQWQRDTGFYPMKQKPEPPAVLSSDSAPG